MDEAARFIPPDEGTAEPTDPALSFIDLYHQTYPGMVRLAFALIGSEQLAEDLVQDTFLRVHARWGRIDNPRAYLRRAVVNACRSAARKARTERHAVGRSRPTIVDLEADEMFDALGALPYRQRAALVLQFYEGLSQSEIAEVLGCRVGTVASLVHRGLTELRRVVDQ